MEGKPLAQVTAETVVSLLAALATVAAVDSFRRPDGRLRLYVEGVRAELRERQAFEEAVRQTLDRLPTRERKEA